MLSSSSAVIAPHGLIRILYAEDIRELRELAQLVLTGERQSVDCADDGIAALERLSANPAAYDLLITDHQMPRLNGLDLVRQVRRLPFHGKVMVFSSALNPLIAAQYHELGVDRVVFKPVYPSYLRQVVAELLPAGMHAVDAL